MSSFQLPWCLTLPRCSVSKEQIGFPWPLFSSRYFSTNADKIYSQFVFFTWLISFSPCRAEFRRQITACKQGSLRLLVSKHVLISHMGTGTGLAWFTGKCWSFSFYMDHFKGLGRRWGWTLSWRWELQIFTAEAVIKSKMMRIRANRFKDGWYKSIIQAKDNWILCLPSKSLLLVLSIRCSKSVKHLLQSY